MEKITFVNNSEPYLSAENLNQLQTNIENAINEKTNLNFKFLKTSSGASGYSTSSADFIQLGDKMVEFEVKKGNFVIVMLRVGGLWITNSGYQINFDIMINEDGTISSTGSNSYSPASFSSNSSTDGTKRNEITMMFAFENLTPGTYNFKPLWASGNSTATANIGEYSPIQIAIFEI